jgi:FaeA-like protein
MTTDTTTREAILDWIARIGAAAANDVADRFGLSPAQARSRLQAAQRTGTIEAVRLLHGQPALYVATLAGLRAAGLSELRPCRVSPGGFAHLREVAQAAVVLEHAHPELIVVGERELRRWESDSGRWLASAVVGRGPDGFPARHRPDLVLWPVHRVGQPGPEAIAIEVELTAKAPRRLAMIIRGWARTRLVGAVVYYATPAAARVVKRAIDEQQASELVHLLPLDEVGRLPPPGGGR